MYPEPLGFIGIHFIRSYGIMLAIAFLTGIMWARKRAAKAGIDPDQVVDLSFIVLISSVVGSRLFYVIYHLDEFSNNILDIINPFQNGSIGIAGLSMMGGVLLALISAFLFFVIKKIDPWPLCDSMMPMFALGIGIARIGCFLNGCCYGLPAHDHWGLVFPPDSAAGYHFPDTPLIPTQLFSSLAGLIILTIVLFSEKYKKFNGHSFWITLGLYGLWRFIIDFYRYYEPSMVAFSIGEQNISRNQTLSLLLVVGAIIAYMIMFFRNSKKAAANAVSESR